MAGSSHQRAHPTRLKQLQCLRRVDSEREISRTRMTATRFDAIWHRAAYVFLFGAIVGAVAIRQAEGVARNL